MSLHIDRITHMSSTHSPTCGKISLTSVPLCPYFLKLNGEGKAAPVRRSVFNVIGMDLPAKRVKAGFGSNVSTWDAPPFMNRCKTRFAFAGNGGFFGASGFIAASVV